MDHPAAHALIELLTSPACLLDRAGHVIHLNAAWREHAGLASDRTEFLSWTQLLGLQERESARARLEAALSSGKRTEFECRLAAAPGAPRWFCSACSP